MKASSASNHSSWENDWNETTQESITNQSCHLKCGIRLLTKKTVEARSIHTLEKHVLFCYCFRSFFGWHLLVSPMSEVSIHWEAQMMPHLRKLQRGLLKTYMLTRHMCVSQESQNKLAKISRRDLHKSRTSFSAISKSPKVPRLLHLHNYTQV